MHRLDNKKIKIACFGFMIFLILFFLFFLIIPASRAYYSIPGHSLYSSGIYGGGYGFYGPYGLNSLGLYGFGGMYSPMGLNSLFRLYGLGGLFGLSGLFNPYGLNNLSTMGCLYGLCGIPSSTMAGLGGLGCLLRPISLLSNTGVFTQGMQQSSQPINMVKAEQAGTWSGTWTSLVILKIGPMSMTLTEDPLTGIISGQVNLLLNKVTNSIPADVTGYLATGLSPGTLGITGVSTSTATFFVLSGGNQSFFSSFLLFPLLPSTITIYTINLVCIMTTPVTMTGTYDVQDILKLNVDSGDFDLTLTAPVI